MTASAAAPQPSDLPWRDRRRALILRGGWLGVCAALVVAAVAGLTDRPAMAVVFIGVAMASGGVVALARRGQLRLGAHLACLLGTVGAYAGIWFDNAGLGPAMTWFAVLTVIYGALATPRSRVVWFSLNFVLAVAFIATDGLAFVPRAALSPALTRMLALVDVILGMGLISAMVGAAAQTARDAERQQADAIARLEVEVAARRAAEAEARAAAQARAIFLATVSHEVRTPLNVIVGLTEALELDGLTPHQRGSVASVRDATAVVLRLLNDTLDLGRVEAGGLQLSPEPTDLEALLDDMGTLLRHMPAAARLKVLVQVDPAARGTWMVDGHRLRQMLLNLGTNALKFTEQGEVELSLRSEGDQLRFAVRDTGPGVAPDVADRLFVPYVQASVDTPRRHGGSGLGLAIVKSLAGLMDGGAGVDTTLGQGSTFWFTVRVQRCAAPAVVASAAASPTPRASHIRVLLVEDDALIAQVVASGLRREGAEVHHADTGADAIRRCQAEAFELILLDAHLPDMDGTTVAAALRALPVGGAIVALTGDAGEDARRRSLAAGMDDHLVKPVTRAELAATLQRFGAEGARGA